MASKAWISNLFDTAADGCTYAAARLEEDARHELTDLLGDEAMSYQQVARVLRELATQVRKGGGMGRPLKRSQVAAAVQEAASIVRGVEWPSTELRAIAFETVLVSILEADSFLIDGKSQPYNYEAEADSPS